MNKSLYLAFIFLLTLSSCDVFKRKSHTELNLRQTVQNVIAGTDSISKLLVLRDRELPPAVKPNLVAADTFIAFGNRYYAVLAEYPNPVYNRFTIIDSYYNVLLMDKSLNGYLAESHFKIGQIYFVRVEENFISKGILALKRTSLYSVDDNGEAELVFRTFTELREPGVTYKQDITQINSGEIQTKIYSTNGEESKVRQNRDIFQFDMQAGRYISGDNTFDSFVISRVHNYDAQTDKPQIISRRSYLKQLGINPSETTREHKLGNFSMPLSDEWNEVKDVKISGFLKKTMTGTKFINNQYGADISVIMIPVNDSAESLIKYPLENISAGNYRVRFSEKISGGKYFYQFFEYSCGSEKFLLILQTLKTTYEIYKSDYQNLINSFSMDC